MTEDRREGEADTSTADSLGDHEYFRRLEELFIALRGSPLLLSPADWGTAREWRQQGIPLDLIERVLREIFDRRAEQAEAPASIRRLAYFRPAVRNAWREVQELGAVEERSPAEPLDLGARLSALAGSIPEDLPGAEEVRVRITGLRGDAREVEQALAAIDEVLLDRAESALGAADREEMDSDALEAIARLSGRLAPAELERTTRLFARRALRRRIGLPVLSLFSPPASSAARSDDG